MNGTACGAVSISTLTIAFMPDRFMPREMPDYDSVSESWCVRMTIGGNKGEDDKPTTVECERREEMARVAGRKN
jgi:hypothetical protein